jgi:hypothetical protein
VCSGESPGVVMLLLPPVVVLELSCTFVLLTESPLTLLSPNAVTAMCWPSPSTGGGWLNMVKVKSALVEAVITSGDREELDDAKDSTCGCPWGAQHSLA